MRHEFIDSICTSHSFQLYSVIPAVAFIPTPLLIACRPISFAFIPINPAKLFIDMRARVLGMSAIFPDFHPFRHIAAKWAAPIVQTIIQCHHSNQINPLEWYTPACTHVGEATARSPAACYYHGYCWLSQCGHDFRMKTCGTCKRSVRYRRTTSTHAFHKCIWALLNTPLNRRN